MWKKVHKLIHANIHLQPPPSAFDGHWAANFSLSSICTPPPHGSWRGCKFFPMTPQQFFGLGGGAIFWAKKRINKCQQPLFLQPPLPLAPWNFFIGFSKGCNRTDAAPPLPTPWYMFVKNAVTKVCFSHSVVLKDILSQPHSHIPRCTYILNINVLRQLGSDLSF